MANRTIKNQTRMRLMSVAIVLALLTAACSASSEDASTSTGATGVALSDISVGETSVEELDRVPLDGLPEDFDVTTIAVMVVVGDIAIPVEVFADDQGDAVFTAPLNPDDPGAAGDVEIFLTDGENDGQRITLELSALPSAPGAAVEFAQFMWDRVDTEARELGSSFAELQTTPFEETPPELFRLKLLQGYIDDGSTNDLMSVLSAEESGLSALDMALVDSVIAKTNPQASFQSPPPPPPPAPSSTPPPPGGAAVDVTVVPSPGSTNCNSSDLPVIENAADLVNEMAKGAALIKQITGATGAIRDDLRDVVNLGSLVPKFGPVISVLSTVLNVKANAKASEAGRYPSALSELRLKVPTTEFNEDFTLNGRWSDVRVLATSTGYNATSDKFDLATDVGGAAASRAGKILKAKNLATGKDIADAEVATDLTQKLADSQSGAFLDDNSGTESTRFCPHTWIVSLPNSYTTTTRSSLDTIVADAETATFAPTETGTDLLIVGTNPKVFPDVAMVTASTEIRTKATAVQLEPNDIEVLEPGDVVSISVNFASSDSKAVKWETTAGTFVDGLGEMTTGVQTRELETPFDADLFDVTVTATLETSQGAFGFDEERVKPSDETRLRLVDLLIDPIDAVVVTGGTVQYTATTPDGQSIEVEWSTRGGSFDDDGLFTAGDEPGTYTVTATAISDPTKSASVDVTVELPELIVSPDGASVLIDNTVQYTAATTDGQPVEVRWSAEGGRINDAGLYTAGDTPGTYTVTATAISDSRLIATVEVTILDTSCLEGTWSLRADEMAEQISARTSGGNFEYLSGDYTMTLFADGTWQAERSQLMFQIVAQGRATQLIIESSEFGTYVADGADFSLTESSSNAVVSIVVPGVGTLDAEAPPEAGVSGSGTYTCERPVFRLTADGFVSTFDYLGPAS